MSKRDLSTVVIKLLELYCLHWFYDASALLTKSILMNLIDQHRIYPSKINSSSNCKRNVFLMLRWLLTKIYQRWGENPFVAANCDGRQEEDLWKARRIISHVFFSLFFSLPFIVFVRIRKNFFSCFLFSILLIAIHCICQNSEKLFLLFSFLISSPCLSCIS